MGNNLKEENLIKTNTILIVDDNVNNLKLLNKVLTDNNYSIRIANNGLQALESVKMLLPDLILLDINMPGINGFEVCKKLKESRESKDVPVIFISAMSDIEQVVTGFDVGGVDYITKPFHDREVLSRIKNQIIIKEMRDKLEFQNKELVKAAKLRDDIEYITRHDLKGPLSPIITYPDIILKKGNLSEAQEKWLAIIKESGHVMLNMINRSMDLFRMERKTYILKPEPVDIMKIIDSIFSELINIVDADYPTLALLLNGENPGESDSFIIKGEELLCYSMLNNLIRNAIEASTPEQEVIVYLNNIDDDMEICIANESSIPESIRNNFFEKFITYGKIDGNGLGTYSAKLSVEIQGGTIDYKTSEEHGTRIYIRFPKVQN